MAPKEKGPVFRVTGLPASQPDDRLSELLKTTIHESLDQSETPFSVSIVPSCYYEDQEKVALVEFHGGVPAFLSKLKDDPLADWQVEMGDDDINFDQHFFGFTQLYSPKQDSPVNADVIAITGLDGHAYGSWRGRGNLGRMWLRHFLERDLPTCRTMTYGYNSKLNSPGTDTLLDYGRGLLEDLKKIRHTEELRKRPLIFIAHSFGGIILAHCLVRAVQSNEDDHPTIAALHKATYGMLLFGIPHKGLLIDDMEKMLAEQNSNVRLSLLEQIKSDSGLLAIQLADFKNLIRDRKVVSFYETRQTRQLEFDYEKKRWARSGDFVTRVDADSALLQLPDSIEEKIPLDADHSVIVKFDARNDRGYTSARGKLQQFEKDAPAVIAARFLQTSNKPSPSSTVPFMRDKDFVGRESVLTEIGEKLQDTVWQSHNRVALVGLGGIGKSQIAIEYTYRLRASDPNIWVFWVHASSPARFEKAYRDIASRVELSGYDDPKGDTLSLVHRWLCDDRNGRWLMVLDNADDSQIFAPHGTVINDTARDDDAQYKAAPLANYLPQTTNGKILVTSRDLIAALGLVGMESNVIRVNPMDEGEALKLLKSRISIEEALEDEARALTMALEYIPLAVSHAAAYIAVRRPRITVPTYLELFRESDKNQTHLLNVQDPRDIRRDSSVSHAVITTWQLSFEQIRKTSPKSADLLSLMAMFDRQVIPEEIVYFTESTVEFEDAVAPLTSFSLIKSHITKRSQWPSEIEIQFGDRFFEMHSLVQLATREWLNIQGEIHKWRRRSLAVMATVLPDDQPGTILYEIPENLAIYQLLLPHAKKVLEYSSQRKREWLDQATIARKISSYLYQTGRYRESYDFCRSALDIREKLRGPQHEDTMECVRELGFILDCLERYQEAEVMARRDLEHCEKESGPELLMSIRAFVARLLQQQGKYGEAQDMYRNVVEIYKDVFAGEDIEGRAILSISETMTIAQDQCEESEASLRQALESCMVVSGQASADTYLNMVTSVMVEMFHIMFTLQDNYEQAELLWLQAFKERVRLLGPENSLTLDSMRDLGWIYQEQGKYKEAEFMYQRALGVSERVLGLEHPTTVRNLYHIGSLWASQGMYKEAESILYRALEGSERVFGKTHHETFRVMDEIANFWTLRNKYEEAESILESVFDAKQQSFGPEHSSTLDTIFSLGSVYIMQGKYRDAEVMLEGALEGLEKAWIPKDANEIVTAHSLKIGRSWARKGKYKEATSMFRRALQGREKILGSEHQDTIEIWNVVQYMVEMWEEAYYADSEFSSDSECSFEYAPDFERLVIEDERIKY